MFDENWIELEDYKGKNFSLSFFSDSRHVQCNGMFSRAEVQIGKLEVS